MVQTLQYLFLGFIQGVTEWLPVSSDGHLVIVSEFFGLEQSVSTTVVLHIASLIVMVYYFRVDIVRLFQALWTRSRVSERQYIYKLIGATAVTVVVALFLDQYIASLENNRAVGWFLLVTTVFVGLGVFFKQRRELTWPVVLILGFVQGLAVLPGVSRSGLMIGSALILGISSKEAFRFAFLAGIPAIFGAFIFTVKDVSLSLNIVLAFFVALIVSYLTLMLLEIVLAKHKFHWFALYTLALGIFLLVR